MSKVSDDVFFLTIAELGEKLRAREFSSVELTRAWLDRIERFGPRFGALALLLKEGAIRQARDADRDTKIERFRSPLQGIPCAVKDLLSIARHPTTWGARPYAGQVFDHDAAVIERLRSARAIPIAKLTMIELAGGGGYRSAAASLTGPARNPWDRTRWAGGSSSGSGAAVAAGLVPFAIGSETSGSILTPSAFCGVTGLRPTYGLVSRYGAMALSWSMDKVGPMCRSAEDCGLVLQAIAGGDSRDPASAGNSFYYTPQFAREFKDLRLGFAPVDFDLWAAPAARPVFRAALEGIRELGLQLVETRLPDFPYGPVAQTIISAEGSAAFEELIASGRVDQLADKSQIAGLRAGLEIPAKDYLRAQRIRSQIQAAFREMFIDIDVLVSPARFDVAPKISEPLGQSSAGEPQTDDRGMRDLIPAGNLAGLPALSLPCGFVDGLPVALQLVARPYLENTLLAIGKAFQDRTDFHRRRPDPLQ